MRLLQVMSVALATACGVAACGGGGGDTAGPAVPPAPIPTAIDSSNAVAVAGATADAALGSDDIGDMADLAGLVVNIPGTVSDSGGMFAVSKTSQGGYVGMVSFVPIGPETLPCAVSGMTTISGNIANPATLSVNDVITASFDMCVDVPGQMMDGTLEMTVTNVDGDILTSENVLLGLRLVATGLSITADGETFTASGDVGTTIDNRTPPIVEGSVFGDWFSVSGMGRSDTLRDYLTIYTEDTSTFPVMWTTNAEGVVESSDFVGAASYETPLTFAGIGDNYPDTGQLLITGANGATLLLRTINNQDVEIDVNLDGMGAPDETIVTTWAELDP